MRQKEVSLFLCYLLLYTCCGVEAGKKRNSKNSANSGSGFWGALTYAAVGGGLLTLGLPALGFTSTGILANSVASSLMSWSAVASGGGVPAGGLVATLQSLGTSKVMAKVGAFLGYTFHSLLHNKEEEEEDE